MSTQWAFSSKILYQISKRNRKLLKLGSNPQNVNLNYCAHGKMVKVIIMMVTRHELCISSYCFRGNYSFLNLEIQRSQYIRPKVTVHKCAETIQGRKLFKGGNYMRKYGIPIFWRTGQIGRINLEYFQQHFCLV